VIPLQRKQLIVDYMEKHGGGSVSDLSSLLGVSEMTVRRDLKALEGEGALRVAYGGAVYVRQEGEKEEPAYDAKRDLDSDKKDRIARFAAERFVEDHSVIILEGGTTVACMVPYLSRFHGLTAVTNGLNTLEALKGSVPDISVLSCGGMLRDVSNTFVGPMAEIFFETIHAHSLFVSASGFTPEQGFTDPNALEVQMKKKMGRAAKRRIMLLDSGKFGKLSLQTSFALSDIDILITDSGASTELLEQARRAGVETFVAEEPGSCGA
jgi:DeoR/GlpR family transcriptional regulator of sugar metabolism